MAIALCLVAGLLPILVTPGILFYFDVTPKVLVLLGTSIFALFFCLLTKNLQSGFFTTRAGRLWTLAITWQSAALFFATAFSTHPELSFSGTNWRRFGAVTQLALFVFALLTAAWLAYNRHSLILLLRTTTLTGGLIAAYAVLQYFGWDPVLPGSSYQAGEGVFTIVRPPGTLGHANYLATYLLFVMFSAFALSSCDSLKGWRFAGRAIVFLSGVALILTGTRSAWLGLAAGGLLIYFIRKPGFRRIHAYSGAALLTVLAVFYISAPGARIRARVHWIQEDPLGGARLLLWRDAGHMAAGRWMAGYGPETFSAEFPRFQSVGLARKYPDFYHESPHNIFLDVLCEQGLLGLIGLVGTVSLGLYASWEVCRKGDQLGISLAGSLAAMLVSLQFSAFTVSTAFFLYLAIAAVVALTGETARAQVNPALGWSSVPIAAVLIGLFAWFGLSLAFAEYQLARVQSEIEHKRLNLAVNRYAAARRWEPLGTSYDLYYSRATARYSQTEPDPIAAALAGRQSLEAAIRACTYPEERQNAFYHLAILFASQNDPINTEKSLRAAISIAPNWFKPHWSLAQILRWMGRMTDAQVEARTAQDLDGGKHKEVTQTLVELRTATGHNK